MAGQLGLDLLDLSLAVGEVGPAVAEPPGLSDEVGPADRGPVLHLAGGERVQAGRPPEVGPRSKGVGPVAIGPVDRVGEGGDPCEQLTAAERPLRLGGDGVGLDPESVGDVVGGSDGGLEAIGQARGIGDRGGVEPAPADQPPVPVAPASAIGQVFLGRDRPGEPLAVDLAVDRREVGLDGGEGVAGPGELLVEGPGLGLEAVDGRGRGGLQRLQVVERAGPERQRPEVDLGLPLGLGQVEPAGGELSFEVALALGPGDGVGQGPGEPGGVGARGGMSDPRAGREPRHLGLGCGAPGIQPGRLLGQRLDLLLEARGEPGQGGIDGLSRPVRPPIGADSASLSP